MSEQHRENGMAKNMARERANHALKQVPDLSGDDSRGKNYLQFLKCYRSYVERLGPAILINGLGQALASELAAAGANPNSAEELAHDRIAKNLSEWLSGEYKEDGKVYLKRLVEADQAFYVTAQSEALAWLTWHKKFCRAALPREEVPA